MINKSAKIILKEKPHPNPNLYPKTGQEEASEYALLARHMC